MNNIQRLLAGGAVIAMAGVGMAVTQDPGKEAPQKREKGKFDPAAMQEAAFKRADADGDGKISKDEFKKYLETARQGRGGRPGADKKDGEAPKKKEGEGAPKRTPIDPEEAFKKLDANNDGFIDKDEFKKVREIMGGGRTRGGDKKSQ